MDNSTDELLSRAFLFQTTMLTHCKRSYDNLIEDLTEVDADDAWLDALIDSLMVDEEQDGEQDYVPVEAAAEEVEPLPLPN